MPRARHRPALKAVEARQPDETGNIVREYHRKVSGAIKVVGDARVEVAGIFKEAEDQHHLHRGAFKEASKRARQYGMHPESCIAHIEAMFEYLTHLGIVHPDSNIAFNQGSLPFNKAIA